MMPFPQRPVRLFSFILGHPHKQKLSLETAIKVE
jgi:hypothetical protein